MATPQVTATLQIPISEVDDMRRTVAWWRELLPETAREELAFEQARGNLKDPAVFVDGRKANMATLDSVKPFGNIRFVEGTGPLDAAIQAAAAFIESAAPRRTGHYVDALRLYVNGRLFGGVPTAEQVGLRGNVEFTDLAPYAAMAEIQTPRGVIYGAYTMLARTFGGSLSIGFRYTVAAEFGGHDRGNNWSDDTYLNVPVLSIGNPASTVKPGVKRGRPGTAQKARRRTAHRALNRYVRGL